LSRTATGIDVGSSTAKLLRGEVKGNGFVVQEFVVAGNPSGTIADGWRALAAAVAGKPKAVRVGLSGREVNVRYTRVPRVADWQLKKLMRFETEEIASQSDSAVVSDFNVLPEIPEVEGEDVVMLCMARESLLDEHLEGLAELGGALDAFTPNAVALYNAFLHFGVVMEDTVLVANIGRENVDIILVRGTDLLFARNLSGGSRLFDQAIAQRLQIAESRAEELKLSDTTLRPNAVFKDPTVEKASRALMSPAGQVLSLLQSTVLFCKSQIKLSTLKLDRVLVCGGGAGLDGLTQYLQNGLGVPVEVFDPFQVVDTSRLSPEGAALLEEHRMEAVVALGLATSASDPESYAIELLPEAVRKKREFVQGQVWLIAAGVLAAAFLGFRAVRQSGELAAMEREATELGTRVRAAKRNDQQTRALLEENRELASYADELHALAGSGEQIARVVEAIERNLPQEFWLENMTSDYGSDEELGVARDDERPILRIKGRARDGASAPSVLFEEFVGALQEAVPEARISQRMGSTQTTFTLDVTLLAPPGPAADETAPSDEG